MLMKQSLLLATLAKKQNEESRSSHLSDVIYMAPHLKQVHLCVYSPKQYLLPGLLLSTYTSRLVT